jgi:hypothetical protein
LHPKYTHTLHRVPQKFKFSHKASTENKSSTHNATDRQTDGYTEPFCHTHIPTHTHTHSPPTCLIDKPPSSGRDVNAKGVPNNNTKIVNINFSKYIKATINVIMWIV